VKVKIHGHEQTVTRKVKQTVGGRALNPLAMPTEFVAQNGAVIHQSTPVRVTGCKANKPAKKAKQKGKKGGKKK